MAIVRVYLPLPPFQGDLVLESAVSLRVCTRLVLTLNGGCLVGSLKSTVWELEEQRNHRGSSGIGNFVSFFAV